MAVITGTNKNDTLVDFLGFDTFNGKGGIDTLLSDFGWLDDVMFDMLNGEATYSGRILNTFRNIENLTLGGGADVIGDNNNNVIRFLDTGNHHDNEVHAGGGNDRVYGGIGNDELYGDDGDDKLYGGDGDDELNGGAGNDKLYGGDGDDELDGGFGNDKLYGGDGDDFLWSSYGNDKLYGGDGKDYLNGGHGNDKLYGGGGDDILYGKDGRDTLSGGDGNDFLAGGDGKDLLTGGAGSDTFRFFSDNGSNTITDFEDGIDVIDLWAFGFVNTFHARSHFYEIGSSSDNVVGFEHDGTTIKIMGLDLGDIGAEDLII